MWSLLLVKLDFGGAAVAAIVAVVTGGCVVAVAAVILLFCHSFCFVSFRASGHCCWFVVGVVDM